MKYAIILLAASALSVSAREYVTYITQLNEFPNPDGEGILSNESIIADIDATGRELAPSSIMGRATFELIADEVLTQEEIDRGLVETQFIMDRDTVVGYDIEAEVTVIGPSADPHNLGKDDGTPARTKAGEGFHVEYKVSGLQTPGTVNSETGVDWPLAATELKLQHVVDNARVPSLSTATEGKIDENGTQTVFFNTALVNDPNSTGELDVQGKETFSVFVLPDIDFTRDALQDEDSVIVFPKENGDIRPAREPEDGGNSYREAPSFEVDVNNVYPNGNVFVVVSGGALATPILVSERKNTSAVSDSFSFNIQDIDDELLGSGDYIVELRYVDYFFSDSNDLLLEESTVLDAESFTLNRGIEVRSNVFTAE